MPETSSMLNSGALKGNHKPKNKHYENKNLYRTGINAIDLFLL